MKSNQLDPKSTVAAANQRAEILSALDTLTPERFEEVALQVFRHQADYNSLYCEFIRLLGVNPLNVKRLEEIPFLPISFFKTHDVRTGDWTPQVEFTSSGTTGQTPSRHRVRDLDHYLQNTLRGFGQFYGDPADWLVLALLPSYLEREGSSLVAMAEFFVRRSQYPQSGFFLHDLDRLKTVLENRPTGVPVLLLGVTFALLDFAEQFPMDLSGVTVMETGGMKGRRQEITRAELHEILSGAFGVRHIHSEYGMTELLSQGYALGGSVFQPATTLRVLTREINDPLSPTRPGRTGLLNLIDLANFDSCAFICTEDIGKVHENHSFEVLGRLDAAELRGCNLMIE